MFYRDERSVVLNRARVSSSTVFSVAVSFFFQSDGNMNGFFPACPQMTRAYFSLFLRLPLFSRMNCLSPLTESRICFSYMRPISEAGFPFFPSP